MNSKKVILTSSKYRNKKFMNNQKNNLLVKQASQSITKTSMPKTNILTLNDLSLAYSFKPKELTEKVNASRLQKNGTYREFRKILFRKIVYEIDDAVLIRNLDDESNDFIGQIRKIILLEEEGKLEPALYLQWYYKKRDLPEKFNSQRECISDNEVFLTEETDYTIVECLNGKCQILTYDEYDSQTAIKQNSVFFSRASYDARKQKITNPPFDKWEKHCICQKPFNPDLPYVCCDMCEKWFHIQCLKLTLEQAQNIDFVCKNCENLEEKSHSLE